MKISFSRGRHCTVAAVVATLALMPQLASAEGLFDFLFGGGSQKQQRQQSSGLGGFFADPFGTNQPPPTPPRPVASAGGGSGPAFCVRTCDGRYFPVTARGNSTPVQMCQAFCPASPTRVYFGSSIDGATAANGQRYADSENAFAFRKELKADCTCNGRSSAGLAPVDISLDSSLRPGDVIATTNGLVAYSGVRVGANQTAEFTPVASYPGLTSEVRARLGEMKVAPVTTETIADEAPSPETLRDVAPLTPAPKLSTPIRAKRADLN